MELETIIGLEVHAQISTKTKLFCSCPTDSFGKAPNTAVCPVCMGHPGTLPVPNKRAVEKAVRMAKALKCALNERNYFSRKNYFYPDLPAGYQISQYDHPLAGRGEVAFDWNGVTTVCGITRLHLENDAGKLTHRGEASLVDFNRAGTPLMEIVTEPDLRSPQGAVSFAQELRRILVAADASDADMFKGMMRFDASISLRPKGDKKFYPRVEIKNLNSFKSLERALVFEEKRLMKLWKEGKAPDGEVTVGWLDDEEKTVILRDKESAADYRYFPEPDIPPLLIDAALVAQAGDVALPQQLRAEYIDLGLKPDEATLLIENPELKSLFDLVHERVKDARRVSSLLLTQLLGFLNAHEKTLADAPSADHLAELLERIADGTISGNAGKEVLEDMVVSGKDAATIIADKGMAQISDDSALLEIIDRAIKENADAIESYKAGKQAALGAVVGWIMKESRGQANPKKVNQLLLQKLG